MQAPFNIVGIDHVVLRAANPAALERFYLNALGLSFEMRQGELAQLRAGNALIDIVPADEAGPAGGTSSTGGANLDHLCQGSSLSTLRRSPNIWRGKTSPVGRRLCVMVPRAKAHPSTCEIRKATASSLRDRQLTGSDPQLRGIAKFHRCEAEEPRAANAHGC
jgi:catechol 2,3-dioxygenase-like lactoylglutathione lyase family enzyme